MKFLSTYVFFCDMMKAPKNHSFPVPIKMYSGGLMQLHLTLASPDFSLPASYRQLIHGMIYHTLAQDPDFSAQLHDRGIPSGSRVYKHFTFSQLEGRYHIHSRQIRFAGKANLEIRSVDERMITLLARRLCPGRKVKLGPCEAEIIRASVTDDHLLVPSVRIRMRSPAVAHVSLEDGRHTRFFSPQEDAFFCALSRNAQRKWISLHGAQEGFSFLAAPVPDAAYKSQVSMFKETCITGWLGEYQLISMPQVIDLLYQTGLGEKNPQGFGLFDPVDSSLLTAHDDCAILKAQGSSPLVKAGDFRA